MFHKPNSAPLTDEDIAIRRMRPHLCATAVKDANRDDFSTAGIADAMIDGGVARRVAECIDGIGYDAMAPWAVY